MHYGKPTPEYAKTMRWGRHRGPGEFLNPSAWPIRDSEVKPAGAVPGQQAQRRSNAATSPANSNRTAPRMGGYATSTRARLEDWLATRNF
jgi:hypothetical protein